MRSHHSRRPSRSTSRKVASSAAAAPMPLEHCGLSVSSRRDSWSRASLHASQHPRSVARLARCQAFFESARVLLCALRACLAADEDRPVSDT